MFLCNLLDKITLNAASYAIQLVAFCTAAECDQMGQECTVCDHTAQTGKKNPYLLYLQCHLQSSAAAAQNEDNINSTQSMKSPRTGCSLSNDCWLTV